MKTSYISKHLAGTFIFFFIIFLSAGRIYYLQGLVYLGISVLMITLSYTVLKLDSDLLSERSKPGPGSKKWDKIIIGLSGVLTIVMFIVAGLDSGRFNWSPKFHWSLYIIGFVFTATGQLLFLIAQKQNKFFSSTVRIQTEREHTVCETGLYKFVRHPAYLGSIIQTIGFPLLMGSLWSIIPVSILLFLHILRTYFEDETLKSELNGFIEYSHKTRYKIVPLVW